MLHTRARGQNGFTLVEVVLVCGLLALVSLVAVPSFLSTTSSLKVKNGAYSLAADIRLTQGKAQQLGTRSRLLLRKDPTSGNYPAYDVQVATTQTAEASCSSGDYVTVKHVDLTSALGVVVSSPTLECLVFESTGRTAWTNPTVLEDLAQSDVADLPAETWTRYFDGVQKTGNVQVLADDAAVKWKNRSLITATVDMGQPRLLESICPELLQRTGDGIYYPTSVQVYWSPVTGPTPPTSAQWQLLSQFSPPYVTESIPKSTTNYASRTCPQTRVNGIVAQRVQYLRFVFTPQGTPASPKTVALDEIVLSPLSMTVSSTGRSASRTVAISSVTGRISVN